MGRVGGRGRGRGRAATKTLLSAGAASIAVLAFTSSVASAAPPSVSPVSASEVTTSSAKLSAEINPNGKATLYRFEYGPEACPSLANPCASTPKESAGGASTPVAVSVALKGLPPATLYHARVVAESGGGTSEGPDSVFATFSEALKGLPDNRSYEQSTPTEKNGLDAEGSVAYVRASSKGDGISFLSTFGIPGGQSAGTLPTYLASREAGEWSTKGLLAPASYGEESQVLGWLADFSVAYAYASNYATPRTDTLLAEPKGGEPIRMTPYVHNAAFAYVGATEGGAVVFFEASAKLPPEEGKEPIAAALEGARNVYAWDRESGRVSLVSALGKPESKEEAPLPLGGFAGPYAWGTGIGAANLAQGGAQRLYYLQDIHTVTPEGDVYFTEAGSGQLYLRENPTMPQSAVDGAGKCTEEEMACTVRVSASKRTIGGGEGGADSAGPQPAAFQGASQDGKAAYFTSPEMLTNDANTGPEQPPASIGRCALACEEPSSEAEASFIPKKAIGLLTDSEYIYWADPIDGTIGRAKLGEPASADPAFIVPGPTECGKETEPGVREEGESKPRYLAIDSEYIYWTNTGCEEVTGKKATEGGGSIGRAKLDGSEVEAACIPGRAEVEGKIVNQVDNPQGIAVDAEHIYWANDSADETRIARGGIDCEEPEARFFTPGFSHRPFGLAIDETDTSLYFAAYAEGSNSGFIERVSLNGKEEKSLLIGEGEARGIALDATHVYWASQGQAAIGRASLAELNKNGACETTIPDCEEKFIPVNGSVNGVAVNATHVFWSANGEIPPNPGNDLYRFEPQSGTLTDLTPDPEGDGAEVQGVLGASPDGSRVYFVANGALGEEGTEGTCKSTVAHGSLTNLKGHCDLYLWREGEGGGEATIGLIAQLSAEGPFASADTLDWAPSPTLSSGFIGRTARLTDDGKALLFRSSEKLSDYENEGTPELYLYREGAPIVCVSCDPSGEAPGEGPKLGRIELLAGVAPAGGITTLTRNLSADGKRVFFETSETLTPSDTGAKGAEGESCPVADGYPSCIDVYEWEAEGSGQCKPSSLSYAPMDRGCLYLISPGTEHRPSLLADASETGEDVFFFSFGRLVGQDKDELRDVYDARVGGGIPSQNPPPPPPPCESAESCHGPAQAPAAEASPATPYFHGPQNPKPKRHKAKKHHKKHGGHHRKKKGKAKHKHRRARAHAGRRAGK